MEARNPGLPRCRTFRPEPDRAAPREPRAEFLALGKAPRSARLPRAAETASAFRAQRCALLLPEALAFFLALGFPLLSAHVCVFSCFCVRLLFRAIFLVSVWVLACGAVLTSVKQSLQVSRAVSDLVFPPRRLLILLLERRWPLFVALQRVDASSLICRLPPLPLGSEIFLVSETTPCASRPGRIDRGGCLVPH